MEKYLVMWRDSAGLPRAWGYSRDKNTAKRQAAKEKTIYKQRHCGKILLTEEIKIGQEGK